MTGGFQAGLPGNPLQAIEAILEEGKKASTYKLALLRAINDWVIEHPTREGDQRIPISWLAIRFIDYYWPLLVHERPIRQTVGGRGGSQLHKAFAEFQQGSKAAQATPVAPTQDSHWASVKDRLLASGEGAPSVSRLVAQVRRLLLDQPMQYLHNVSGARLQLFGLRTAGIDEYEAARREAMSADQSRWIRNAGTVEELLADDPTVLWVPGQLYEGLVPLRYCVRAALIGRWAQLCETIPDNANVGPVLPRLEEPNLDRDTVTMSQYRRAYDGFGLDTCWISGTRLQPKWALDHVIPWSRFPVQSFWNLAPANSRPNSQKSNHIVRLEGDLGDRYEAHIESCLAHDDPLVRRDLVRLYGPAVNPVSIRASDIRRQSQRIVDDLLANTGLPEWQPPSN